MLRLPDCCTPSADAGLAEQLYCAYNRGGDPKTAGRNYQGDPCPVWLDLPRNVRAKWEAVARWTVPTGEDLRKLLDLRLEPQDGSPDLFGGRITRALREPVRRDGAPSSRPWARPVHYVGQLVRQEPHQLLARHAFGTLSLGEVEEWLAARGLRLGMTVHETEGWTVPVEGDR